MDWNPLKIFQRCFITKESHEVGQEWKYRYAILLLNQPLLNKKMFCALWNGASFRISVDGGGNQLSAIRSFQPSLKFPNVVSGDLDSIEPKVLEIFRNQAEIEVVETPNQDETDFTKALRVFENKNEQNNLQISKVVAFCEPSGRFDQIMGNMETLFHAQNILSKDVQLFLMGSESFTWLLPIGSHKIDCLPTNAMYRVRYCSLIPIGSPCEKITTTGLKWNLTNDTLAFGHLVSTSNEIDPANDKQIVTVQNSAPIVWSMEIELNP